MLESFSYRATSAEELKVLRSCPEVLAIADGAPENASIATSTAVNAIFLWRFIRSLLWLRKYFLSSDASLRHFNYIYSILIIVVLIILSAKVCPLVSHKGQRNPMKHGTKSTQWAISRKPILTPDMGRLEYWSTTCSPRKWCDQACPLRVEQAEITQTMIMETQLIQIPMVPSMEDLPYKTLFINCDSNEVGNIMRRIYDAALRHHIFPIDGLLDEPGQIGNSIRKGSV